MLAIGFDPGTRNLGWGLVRREGNRMTHVAHGVLRMNPEASLATRLCVIDEGISQLLSTHEPDVGSVESIFFNKDAQAAAKLGHARGVILLGLARAGLDVFEYPPARVKRTVTGNGQAEKRQVAQMVKAMLALRDVPPADAADALAIAITHLRLGPLSRGDSNAAGVLAALGSARGRSRQSRVALAKLALKQRAAR
ncbi:MAG: crossover junction endodeoxyribonuclease RuvC [Myxococcales bacterium]|nr:crossover junction endodeoxyribonuclease RuvC [Myxococcales bacterium]